MNSERLYPIWFVLCALAGAVIGAVTGHGAIRGLTDGMLIAALPLFLLLLAYPLLILWRPTLPICRCRQCNHKGYKYVGPTDGLQVGGSVRFRCPQCGRVYELSRDRFSVLENDCRTVPYMHHTKWGRWKETKAEQASADDVAKRAAPEE
jgi:predicted RNA-binding Zn-ribbon protein involved in translation (DUF1610 family)